MKNSTLYIAVSLTVVLFIIGLAFSTGPAAGGLYRTGAPMFGGGTEATCSSCHSSGAATFGEPTVSVTVAATDGGAQVGSYLPGQTYFISVNVSAPMGSPGAYGFQTLFLKSSDDTQAGTFSSPGSMAQISNGPSGSGRFYPEHSDQTPAGSWTFQWTAPAQGTGAVDIYGVGNSVNFNGGRSGDSGSTSPTIKTLAEQVLPVELASITARVEKSKVALTWVTATEDNTSHFEVERSTDGELFTTINQVQAHGSSQVERGYELMDDSAPSGTNFYRLRMVDFDDTFAYSPVVSATVEAGAIRLGAFPNPAEGMVRFSADLDPETNLVLRDGFGRQLWAGKTGNGVDLLPYPAGIYLLEAVIDGERAIERVVKR